MLFSQARAIPTILFQRVGKAQSEVERKKKNSLQNEKQEQTREEEENHEHTREAEEKRELTQEAEVKHDWSTDRMNLYVEVRIFPKETEGGYKLIIII